MASWSLAQTVSLKDILGSEQSAEQTSSVAAKPVAHVGDEFSRGQPRSAIHGYLEAAKNNDYELASAYLDYRNVPKNILALGEAELARQLYVVLNRAFWVDLDAISDQPEGDKLDGLPVYRELVGRVALGSGSVDILLQRVPRESDRVKIWKISNVTVTKIPALNKTYAYTELGEWLSQNIPAAMLLGVELWQWVYIAIIVLVYFLLAKTACWLFSRALKLVYKNTAQATQRFIERPVALLLALILARAFVPATDLSIAAKAILNGHTLIIVAWLWLFFSFIDLMKLKLAARLHAQNKPLAVQLLRPLSRIIKVFVVITGLLLWFENLGFSATTLLAGLGVGGLAIALAAQKTAENFIAAVTLYVSAPVKVGQFCRFGNQLGSVEEIGLRATRIRTLDRTVIHVANSDFVGLQLENYSERERIAFKVKLQLLPSSQAENLEAFITDVKQLLENHPRVAKDILRVHVTGFTHLGIAINIMSYLETTQFDEYLNISHVLNLSLLNLINDHGLVLATIKLVDET